MSDYFIQTEHMTVGYGKSAVVRDIGIGLNRGEILTLIGPNGAGKSTILKSMTRQLQLLAGRVCIQGNDVLTLTERQLARRMAVVLTGRVHPELMSCRDVVAAGRYPYTGRLGILAQEDRERVEEALRRVHAEELADCDFERLSDGQRQRILLARALCQEPEILVMDEPTSFLDVRHKLELLAILKELVREKKLAVVLSLHELDLAQKVSDRVVCICGDRIERCGPPEEIFTEPYIHRLYGIRRGSYNAVFGCVELEPPAGSPQVFVIGGGGSGIAVYRRLQRQGTPFAAGVLHRSDLDYPVARALASCVIEEDPFMPVGEKALHLAEKQMVHCGRVICTVEEFGPMNEGNRRLREKARQLGILQESL